MRCFTPATRSFKTLKSLLRLAAPTEPGLLVIRIVILMTFIGAMLFVVRSPNVINSAGLAQPSGPLTLVVNNLGDAADVNVGDGLCDSDAGTAGDQCTLRAALQETNSAATDDTINFDLPASSTINLNTALPDIQGNVAINGPGADLLSIQRSAAGGTPEFRIFQINSGKTVNISGLTITNGKLTAPNTQGGGIYNDSSATLTLTNCTVSRNKPGGDLGGGIFSAGKLTLVNSTVSGNTAIFNGGGIYNGGTLTLTNSTVSGNTAGIGGGIFDYNGTLTLTNSTVSGNTSSDRLGGGVRAESVTLRNTIVAGNFGGDISAGTIHASNSLIGTVDDCHCLIDGANGNHVGVSDPGLAPLAYNGGPTMTQALLPGSPALDAGDNALISNPPFSGPPFTDQRGAGFSRIVDGSDADATATVDIGAFEQQFTPADIVTTTNEDTQLIVPFDPDDTSSITSVNATSDNPILIPNDASHLSAAITGSSGIVTINPAANLFGTSIITVSVNRTGGSTSQTIALTVNSVNDVPSFTKGADPKVNRDAGAQSITNWATNISPGPADESTQKLTFQITGNTNPGLFAVVPAISSSGTLTYTPAAKTDGSAAITVALHDDGGKVNGGVDTSTQTFTVTVRPDNLISFSAPNYSVSETDGNAIITLTRTGGIDNEVVAKLNLTDVTTSPADYRFNPGALDTSFNPTCPGTVTALAVQTDGKVLVGSTASIGITRFNPDGSADSSFAPNAAAVIGGSVIGLQPDGRIVVSSYRDRKHNPASCPAQLGWLIRYIVRSGSGN